MFVTILVLILILGVLILSHELGHLWAAKKAGARVLEFGFGFPPRILQKKINGTNYSLNLIPLGGYVKIHGEQGNAKGDKDSFASKSILSRAGILSAGVGMNILVAILLMIVIAFFKEPWYQAVFVGIGDTFRLLWLIIEALYQIISSLIVSGSFDGDVLGPVGIASVTSIIIDQGVLQVIHFTALLSLNLAIINILPFPALDGGRLLFLLIEKIKGSPVSSRVEYVVHTAGFALLMLLMVFVTWKDIARII